MTKKVFELAREMGVSSKDLIGKAESLGIDVKNHMSALSDADIDKIKSGAGKPAAKSTSSGRKVPVGRPIVDEEFLANKKKPPVGKPLVNEEMLARREKAKAEGKTDTAPVKPVVEDSSVEKHSADTKETPSVKKAPEKEPEKKSGKKPEPEKKAAPAKKPAEKTAAAKPAAEKQAPAKKEAVKAAQDKKAAEHPEAGDAKETKAPAETKEVKKEHIVKTVASERASMPRIKIISRAKDQKKAEAAKKSSDGRKSDDGRKSSDRSGRRTGNDRKNDRRTKKNGDERGNRRRGGAEGGEGRDSRGGNRPQRNGGGNRSAAPAAGTGDSRSGKGRRDDRRSHVRRDDRNKFSKFEKKSLEKKERKKYTKPKQEVVEEVVEETLPEGTIRVNVPITVAGFCEQAEVSTSKVIMTLMKLGIMANINQNIDEDTLMVLADDLGISVVVGQVEEEEKEEGIEDFKDREKDLKPRPPIITVMGHVDHGKTSLLDAIRKTNVTSTESGGITQAIGASEVSINGQKIVFLDTPGHEAFTAMRARGAHVTDIAVLVVAADDSVKPQTVESISHAKAAGVPIIVAINKMDKPGANPDLVKKDLADHGVLVEDWGGDVISVPVSAKTGEGITNLLEMILLQAEVLELKANPNRLAMGSVIEARLDRAKGPVASLLVLNGTLQAGQSIVAGTCSGRIRLMVNDKGEAIKKAGPATAVEILGLTDVPQAGDEFNAVRDDKVAREIAARRQEKLREEVLAKNSSMTLDKLFSQIQEGDVKELNLIIKGDVQGSVGALNSSLEKLNNENVKVNVVHSGVGTVSESDIMLAETSDAVIIGFNVRPSTAVTTMADQKGVEIRLYRVIYDVINDVEAAMKGMLDPEYREEVLGKAEIRDTFKVPGVGVVAGAYITEGKVVRNEDIRLVRDGIVIHEGRISSLKRFKDDAKEVAQGYECGIGIEDYNDVKIGDVIECFTMVEIER